MQATSSAPALALYGGTFDPVHNGHIGPVQQAAVSLGIDAVAFLPCHIPPHKASPHTAAEHRVAMLQLVCHHNPLFTLDTREILGPRAGQPSYTAVTLEHIKAAAATELRLYFFMGMDSLHNFHRWHNFRRILELCHIVVCVRPGYDKGRTDQWDPQVARHITADPSMLKQRLAGYIYIAETLPVAVSSSGIRAALARHNYAIAEPQSQILTHLPPYVLSYIRQHHLYCVLEGAR